MFSPADLVAYVSQFVTLEPGDLLLTGTPAGVGHGMDPPVYLAPGQVVRTTIGHSASSGTVAVAEDLLEPTLRADGHVKSSGSEAETSFVPGTPKS